MDSSIIENHVYWPEFSEENSFGSQNDVNYEVIAEMEPDVVITAFYSEDLENALNEAGKSIDNALTEAGDALESGWNSMRDGVDSYFEQRKADKEKAKKEEEAGKKEDQKR